MSKLPLKARLFLWAVYCLGALSALASFLIIPQFQRGMGGHRELWLLPLFVAGAVFAGQRKIRLFGNDEDAGTMSLSFAVIYASLLHFGPQWALLVGVASTLATCLLQPKDKRQSWSQVCFNVSVGIIEIVFAGSAFLLVNRGTVVLDLVHSPTALCAAALIFFFCNTLSVATIIALCSDENPFSVWRESFLWTAPSFLIGAAVATAVTLMSQVLAHHLVTSAVTLVCMGLILYLIHGTYKVYVARTNDLVSGKERLANLYLATIRSLALAIDAKDQYTHKHILRVQKYAIATAVEMGIDGDELSAIETGALLHDIGKLGVPEYVLLKPGRLTDDEFAKIKEHPRIGADILEPVEFPWPVLPVVKYHHERLDGTGYPYGLKGDEIPRTARILAVVDVYDALTSDRSYRNAWTHARAMEEIQRCVGTSFDPLIVDAFARVIEGVRAEMASSGTDIQPSVLAAALQAEGRLANPRSILAARAQHDVSADLSAFREIAQTLSGSLGLDEIVRILADRLQQIFPRTGCVFLLAQDFEATPAISVLTARAAAGLGNQFFAGCRTLSSQSLSLQVASGNGAYRGIYDHDDLLPNSVVGGAWSDLKHALIVPVRCKGYNLGTINLYHADSAGFAAYDQSILEMIAEQAGIAVFNGMLYERASNAGVTDDLTGLANLQSLSNTIEDLTCSGDAQNFAVLCLDVDNFKAINESFGLKAGDTLLTSLGTLFRESVGAESLVARSSDDEFLVVLAGASKREAEAMAWRIAESVNSFDPDLRHPQFGSLRVGVSAGVACFPADGTDPNTLLSVADMRRRNGKLERQLLAMTANNGPAISEILPQAPGFAGSSTHEPAAQRIGSKWSTAHSSSRSDN